MVFVETNRFKPDEVQRNAARTVHLPVATSDKLIGAALAGLAAIGRDGCRYKRAGVMLLDLHPAAAVQAGLFDARAFGGKFDHNVDAGFGGIGMIAGETAAAGGGVDATT
jgi:hypothetical protein